MKHLKFSKGQFITEATSNCGSFAVFEGEVYESSEKGGPNEYSLMCFFNPEHYTQDSNGKYKKEYVFECDVDDETCEYIIDDTDMDFWRPCTEDEIQQALKFLAEVKHIAYDEKEHTFRKLRDNEKISFEPPKNTGACGGNVQHRGSESGGINPFYGRGCHGPGSVGNPPVKTTKTITRFVSKDWEQKEPMTNMSEEHTILVAEQCEKLRFAFDSYNVSTNVMRYPTNGSQVPVRGNVGYDACGWPIETAAAMFGNYCGWEDYYE